MGIGGSLLGGFGRGGIYGDVVRIVCGRGKSGGVRDCILGGDKEIAGTSNGCGVWYLICCSTY